MTTEWMNRAVSAADALAPVKSGLRIFVQGAAATPTPLIEALAARRDLDNVTLYHMHTAGPAPFAEKKRKMKQNRAAGSPPF